MEPTSTTPKIHWLSRLKQMGWPVAVVVALLSMWNPKLADNVSTVLNKPDAVDAEGNTAPEKLTNKEMNDLIASVVDIVIKKMPKPVTDTEPKPPVVEPKPEPKVEPKPPAPKPVDGALAGVVEGEDGKPITTDVVESGKLFRVSAKNTTGKYSWQTVKFGDVHLIPSTDGLEFFGYLEPGQWVDFSLTDFGSQNQVSFRITCNQGPQPPPDNANNDAKPVQKGKVSLVVLYDKNITPDAAIVLNATDVWNRFTASGNDWQMLSVTDDTLVATKAKADAAGVKVPTLLIYDKTTQQKLKVMPLPLTTEALVSVVNQYTGG